MTASLQGEIRIRTRSIDEAIDSINKMGKNLRDLGKQDKGVQQLSKEFETAKKQAATYALRLKGVTQSDSEYRKSQQRTANLLAKASSSVANFSQRVEQSGASQEKQNQIIGRARQQLEMYRQNLATAGNSGLALQTANTQLSVSMAELGRELKETTQGGVAQERTLGTLQVAYERLNGQIVASGMSEEQKAKALQQTNQAYQQARGNIQTYGRNSVEATKAQTAFRSQTVAVTQAIKTKNTEMRNTEMANWRKQMTDLTGSVQLALGPLSGVASRITALSGLFKRNAAPIAALVAAFTGFTVSLARTLSVGREAERQMLALDAQVEVLGLTAVTSGGQLNDMARRLADATLSSAQEMRGAQSALMQFRNIGVGSFEEVLLTAQGLSQTVGQGLSTSIRQLGRLLNDPISNFDALSRAGIQFNDVEKERIKTLVNTGRLQQAQNEILERFIGLQERAKNETGGLSGQLDALADNTAMVAEKLFFMGGTSTQATEAMKSLNEAIKAFGDSDAALGLAEVFGKVIGAAGTAIEFLIGNINVVSAAITGLLVMGLGRAVLALGGFIVNTRVATATKLLFTRSLTANVVAMATFTKGTIAATTATRALGMAIRTLIPFVGIAITALELFGVINLFSPSQQAQINNMQDELSETRKRAEAVTKELEGNTEIEVDTGELEKTVAVIQEMENRIVSMREEIKKMSPLDVPSGPLQNYSRMVGEAERRVGILTIATRLANKVAEERIEGIQKEAQAQQDAIDKQDSYNSSLERALRAAKSLTDSEGSRIDSINEQIKGLEELLFAREDGVEIDKEAYKEGIKQLEMLIERREEMRKNSRAHREAERSALRLIRIEADMQEQLQRTAIFTNSVSESQAEYALRMVDAQREVGRYTEQVRALSEADRMALAETLSLTEAQKLSIISSGGSAESVEVLAQALAKMSFESKEAERNFRNMIAAQNAMNQLQGQLDPFANLDRSYDEQGQAIRIGLTGEERDEALASLETWFQLEQDAIIRHQERLKEDTMRFHPLTETEMLQRDFEDRQAVLERMYAEDEEKLAEHMENLKAQYDKQQMFVKFQEGAKNAGMVMDGVMEAMAASGREQTKEYQYIALAQATIAQAVAIAKAWQEGGPYLGAALAGLAAASVGSQIAAIRSQNFNTGGYVSGKGTGKSDSIPANLSNGEFVLQKSAVDMLGVGFLNRLNKGEMEGFSTGGFVARNVMTSGGGSSSPRSDINVQIIDQSTRMNGTDTEVREETDDNGERQLKVYVRDAVRDLTNNGEFDRTQRENFGNKRRGIRR